MTSWYAIRARGTGAEVAIYDEIGAYGISAHCPTGHRSICG
jgi:ATP-dependent Clp protease protease subunit